MSECPTRDLRESRSRAPAMPRPLEDHRRGQELVAERVFRPLARPLVALLASLRVSPVALVLANAVAGLAAAAAIATGELLPGALLLQVKTLLDNADGQLARATGQISVLGRYLDTESDLVVNALLFSALAVATDLPVAAAVSFVALTLVLSAEYNADVLYRRARGETFETQPAAEREGVGARVSARMYRVFFAPQDRVLQWISERRLERIVDGASAAERHRAALEYHDQATVTVLANLGLSTQLAALGSCLVLGVPAAYFPLVLVAVLLLPVLQIRRERLARLALAG